MMRPFATVHTFCASRVWFEIFGFFFGIYPLTQWYFCAVYDYVEKADLAKEYRNPNRKLWVTMHFS